MFREMFQMLNQNMNFNRTLDSWSGQRVWSMASLGNLKKLPRNKSLPYKRNDNVCGETSFPQELFNLLQVADDWNVWFHGDILKGKQGSSAFELRSVGSKHSLLSGIDFLYGVTYGVTSLELRGAFKFQCKVPSGFTVNDLVSLLRSDEKTLTTFVLKYGVLNNFQKDFIKQKGLDGLR